MSYIFTTFDGTTRNFTVNDFVIDNSLAPIVLLGRGATDYGLPVAKTLINLCENFASPNPTAINALKPLRGQTWFNTQELKLKVNVSANPSVPDWRNIGSNTTVANTAPSGPSVGDLWFNNLTGQLLVWDGSNWRLPSQFTNNSTTLIDAVYMGVNLLFVIINGVIVAVWADGLIASVPATIILRGVTYQWGARFSNGIDKGLNSCNESLGFKFRGTSTSSDYADLAERYFSGHAIPPGTVVEIGGENEIQPTTHSMSENVFGVISANPGFRMNDKIEYNNSSHPFVALTGRVPVLTTGIVKKGQRVVSSHIPGVAKAFSGNLKDLSVYCVIGRALEDKLTKEIGLIEVALGAK
jgi:hypothetical protein